MAKNIKNDKSELIKSEKEFERLVTISLIIGIVVISGFIIYYILNPEPGFVTFGILNSDKKSEDYPINATIGQSVFLYVTVENQLNRDFTFFVKILRGDNKTVLKPSGSVNATSYHNTTEFTLNHNQFWISDKLSVSFSHSGADQPIIVELWEILPDYSEMFYEILWLKLNVIT